MSKWYKKRIFPEAVAEYMGLDFGLWECVGEIIPEDAIKDLALAFGLSESEMRTFFIETELPGNHLKEN